MEGGGDQLWSNNKDLLKDIQLLGWHLGCASQIIPEKTGGAYIEFESSYDLKSALSFDYFSDDDKSESDPTSASFLRIQVMDKWNASPKHSIKIKGFQSTKDISLQNIKEFAKSKQITLPEYYFYYKLKSKTIEGSGPTYTIAVHSPLHRFDSVGIISKNTCADIIKTVMVRVNNWIRSNNLQDEIKILITMHDELVYEMPENRLIDFIPSINNIMCLTDVLQGSLGWPIPLTVDAEYGDTWHTTEDFFKEHPELRTIDKPITFKKSTQLFIPPKSLPKATEEVPKASLDQTVWKIFPRKGF
jgi:hypothetical protein